MNGTVLIAGAGLAGSRCAESLRAFGWPGRIVLVGEERHAPYERPALSKDAPRGRATESGSVRTTFWAEQGIELVLGLPCRRRSIRTVAPRSSAREDRRLGVARRRDRRSRATARRAAGRPPPPDARRRRALTRRAARRSSRVVVVGAGFIGGEVASTLSGIVGSVTVVEPAATPLERVLGPEVGSLLASRYRAHGVDLRLGTGVAGFDGTATRPVVRLTDGSESRPTSSSSASARTGRPVEVDALRPDAPSANVFACGDVASWWRASAGRHVRVEHWTSAAGQARAVASGDRRRRAAVRGRAVLLVGSVRPAAAARRSCRDLGPRSSSTAREDAFTARYTDRERPRPLRARGEPRAGSSRACDGSSPHEVGGRGGRRRARRGRRRECAAARLRRRRARSGRSAEPGGRAPVTVAADDAGTTTARPGDNGGREHNGVDD